MIHDLLCEHSGCNDDRSIALTAVGSCSKGIFAPIARHGKSPCFSRCSLLLMAGVDGSLLVFDVMHGSKLLECAF